MATTVLDRFVTLYKFQTDKTGLRELDQAIESTQRKLGAASRGLQVMGTALTGGAVAVGRTLMTYDDAINRLAAVNLDSPAEAMDRYRQQADALSEKWGESATEIIALQEELKRTGLDWQSVLAATPTVLQLAIGNNLSFAESAKIVTQALNAYSFGADQAARVSDVLAKAATQLFPTDLAEMAPALRQVAGLASSLDIPFERLIALIGVLRTAGLPAEMAGTGLRNVLVRMIEEPAGDAQKTIERLGIDWAKMQAMAKAGDIEGALWSLKNANLDTADAVEIFGTEAGNAAIAMIEGVPSIKGFESALNDAAGTTEDAANAMESGVGDAVGDVLAAFERIQIALGEGGLRQNIEDVADRVVDLIGDLEDLDPEMHKLIGTALTAGPAVVGVGTGLNVVMWSLRPALLLFRAFGRVLRFVGLRGGLVTAALSLILDGLRRLRGMTWGEMWQDFLDRLDMIGEAFEIDFAEGIKAVWKEVIDSLTTDFENFADWLTGLMPDWVKKFLSFDWFDLGIGIADDDDDTIYGPAKESGEGYVRAFAEGLTQGRPHLTTAMSEQMAYIRSFMPDSDAERGPLSDLTASGRALTETLAMGVRLGTADLQNAVLNALTLPVAPPSAAVLSFPSGPGDTGTRGPASFSVSVVNHFHGSVGDAEEIGAAVGDSVRDQLRAVVEEFDSQRLA